MRWEEIIYPLTIVRVPRESFLGACIDGTKYGKKVYSAASWWEFLSRG